MTVDNKLQDMIDDRNDIIEKTEQVLRELSKHYNEISILENYKEKLDKIRFTIEENQGFPNIINTICIDFNGEINSQFDSTKFCNSILKNITEKYGLIHFDDELISRLKGTRKMK